MSFKKILLFIILLIGAFSGIEKIFAFTNPIYEEPKIDWLMVGYSFFIFITMSIIVVGGIAGLYREKYIKKIENKKWKKNFLGFFIIIYVLGFLFFLTKSDYWLEEYKSDFYNDIGYVYNYGEMYSHSEIYDYSGSTKINEYSEKSIDGSKGLLTKYIENNIDHVILYLLFIIFHLLLISSLYNGMKFHNDGKVENHVVKNYSFGLKMLFLISLVFLICYFYFYPKEPFLIQEPSLDYTNFL